MIELKTDDFRNEVVTFHISKQDAEDYIYFASEKVFEIEGEIIKVCSKKYPDYYIIGSEKGKRVSKFFLRGKDKKQDESKLKVTIDDYLLLNKFVNFYNKEYDVMKKISKGESIYE